MTYTYLLLAVIAEVIATSALKPAMGFTKLVPTLISFAGYGLAFYFLSNVFQVLPVGVSYAIWSGLGIILITATTAVLFKQIPDFPAIIGMTFIIFGVVIIHVFSKTLGH